MPLIINIFINSNFYKYVSKNDEKIEIFHKNHQFCSNTFNKIKNDSIVFFNLTPWIYDNMINIFEQ